MNFKNTAMQCMKTMDQIILRPRLSAQISIYDRKNRCSSGAKSITLSFGTTLLRALIATMTVFLGVAMFLRFCKSKQERKIRKKYRMKLKKWKQKNR